MLEKALGIIDRNKNKGQETVVLENRYSLESPSQRRKEHHCMVMYRLSKLRGNLEKYKPPINLRSRKKVKFKNNNSNLEQIVKSPLYRGKKLLDMIPHDIQRSLTKVQFKTPF